MRLDQILAIAFFAALNGVVWKLNRHYERSGVIFGVPFSISRARTPRLFRGGMILNWLTFALILTFSVIVSSAIVISWF